MEPGQRRGGDDPGSAGAAPAPGRDRPGIVAPPPLLYLVALAAVIALQWLWPLPILEHAAATWIGGTLLALGLALNLWGAWTMRRARTPINPYRPVETVVTAGAFRLSRNPLYIGLDLILLGLALVLDSLWGVAALLAIVVVMHYGVILPEERYLEERFGEPYRRYRAAVRRYL